MRYRPIGLEVSCLVGTTGFAERRDIIFSSISHSGLSATLQTADATYYYAEDLSLLVNLFSLAKKIRQLFKIKLFFQWKFIFASCHCFL